MEDLLITGSNGGFAGVFEERKLREVVRISGEEESDIGSIYAARVQNIVKNIEAAFVEYEKGKTAYLSLKECRQELVSPLILNEKKGTKWKLNIGDELLVQIEKDRIKTKDPVCTCRLNFTGRYVVLVHGSGLSSVSSKIRNKKRKEELKLIADGFLGSLREEDGLLMSGYHFILRTNSENVENSVLLEEMRHLLSNYTKLLSRGKYLKVFSTALKARSVYLKAVIDQKRENLGKIIVDDPEIYQEIYDYLLEYQKEDLERLSLYEDESLSLTALYGITSQLERAVSRKVWLKSGAYLVIEPTEALTVIDVNSGKAIAGKQKKEDTVLKINLEALKEAAKQIRLRNLSGIILIDFIDMEKEESREILVRTLKEEVAKDPVKTSFVDVTGLYLVELTRKRTKQPLHERISWNHD